MQLAKIIKLPDHLDPTEKLAFLQDVVLYLHDQLEETESVPQQRAFGFIGTTSAIAIACSVCGLGMISPIVAIPGAIVIAVSSLATGVTLAKDAVESPELIDLQKRLVTVLESKELDQWVKLWEEVGTDGFLKRLQYACMGGFSAKGAFRHKSGSHPFDVAVLFGGGQSLKPWEEAQVKKIGSQTKLNAVEATAISAEAPETTSDVGVLPISPLAAPVDPPHGSLTSGEIGLEMLQSLAVSRRSTLLIGDTGAGKSVTQAYLLIKLFEHHPDAKVFVLSQKADSFCGLAQQGRVTLFDPTQPEEALSLIHSIWLIYDERRRLPESERPNLSPVRLILADWLSINQALEDLKSEECVKASRYLSKLADIIYNGRELNVCLLVDLQSYNLAAVGLKADRNSRKNFNLIGLGNYFVDELGMVNESYGVLTNLIGDRYIVADETERAALNATFKKLQPISKRNQRPIIFSGLSPAQLALLPDLRAFKTRKIAATTPAQTPEPALSIQSEDAIAPTEPTNELRISDSLGEPLKTIWLMTKERADWVTVRDVQRKDFSILKGKGSEQIRQYLGLLADRGYGEIDEEGKSHSSVRFRAY